MTDGDWRDGGFRQRRPSVETLAWVAASMGRGSRIVGYRRLTGGVCSAVHRLTVERRGMRTFVVLRQYPGGLGLQGSLEKEIANLGVVARSGLPVPSILASDVAGASTGGSPSLLMTRLPGHVHLNPAEPRSWMTRIAEIAVLLHSLDLPAKMFRPWTDSWIAPLDGFQVLGDAQKPAVWKAAFGVMAAPPPKDTAVCRRAVEIPVINVTVRVLRPGVHLQPPPTFHRTVKRNQEPPSDSANESAARCRGLKRGGLVERPHDGWGSRPVAACRKHMPVRFRP